MNGITNVRPDYEYYSLVHRDTSQIFASFTFCIVHRRWHIVTVIHCDIVVLQWMSQALHIDAVICYD